VALGIVNLDGGKLLALDILQRAELGVVVQSSSLFASFNTQVQEIRVFNPAAEV
jgi:hypothetical protein